MWKWMNENSCAWKQTKVVCVCGGEEEGEWGAHTTPNCVKCKCVHCIQQGKRESEREGEWVGSENCRRQLWQEGERKAGGSHKHLRHVASASWKLMLQTGGFFGQQQKNIKAPFKGLAGSLLELVGGDGERERGPINNLPSQKCTGHETGWGELTGTELRALRN